MKCSIRSVAFSFGLLSYFCWHRPWSTIYFRPTGFEHIKPTMRRVGYTLDIQSNSHSAINSFQNHPLNIKLSLASLQNTFTWVSTIQRTALDQDLSKFVKIYSKHEACLSFKKFTMAGCIWKLFYCGPPPLTNDHCSSSSLLQPLCSCQKETEAKELIT